ncbi:unnamed protein product, partial [Mycena citricolor]
GSRSTAAFAARYGQSHLISLVNTTAACSVRAGQVDLTALWNNTITRTHSLPSLARMTRSQPACMDFRQPIHLHTRLHANRCGSPLAAVLSGGLGACARYLSVTRLIV